MNNQNQRQSIGHDALFRAPGWAARVLTFAAFLGVLAVVSFVVGVWLAVISSNATPLGLGILLALITGLPAFVLHRLTMRSLNAMYDSRPEIQAGPQQTVVNVERPIKIDGQAHVFRTEQIKVNAPADQVARMLAWLKDNPTRTSRAQVMQNAQVSQSTWERVMSALEDAGIVVNMGKSGYKTLDDKLDEMDAKL